HDREGESLEIEVSLYSLNGEQTISQREIVDFSNRTVEVDLNFSEKRIRDGLYLYRAIIRSLADGATSELTGRLVIRN
ncbi:MAG: hypothetical protein RIF46_01960, partial [Cyclobacteriaceae bacterium]